MFQSFTQTLISVITFNYHFNFLSAIDETFLSTNRSSCSLNLIFSTKHHPQLSFSTFNFSIMPSSSAVHSYISPLPDFSHRTKSSSMCQIDSPLPLFSCDEVARTWGVDEQLFVFMILYRGEVFDRTSFVLSSLGKCYQVSMRFCTVLLLLNLYGGIGYRFEFFVLWLIRLLR